MEYKDGMISVVEEGEEVNITPKDRNSVEVIPHAVVFRDDGVYRVDVGNKRIVITKVEQQPCEDVLDKIKAEIIEKFDNCSICEWFEDYDYDENDISEYMSVGHILDIIDIIDKYRK